MLSSGSAVTILLLLAVLGGAVQAQAQPRTLYEEALARETALRPGLDTLTPGTPGADAVIKRVRALVGAYDDMARLFPSSGYSDNALWQGASLAADTFWQFGDAADKKTALRMFDALLTKFDGNPLAAKAPEQMRRLAAAGAAPAVAARSAAVRPPPAPAASATTSAPARPPIPNSVALTAIRQELLPDALRVILELDREVPFHDERLDGPPRVFLDLQNTRAVAALRDAVLPFGDDVVQRVRVGRQLDSRTRVVLDLKSPARYSVYTLYNPYRVVIDFERAPIAPAGEGRIAPVAPAASKIAPTRDGAGAPVAPSANTSGSFSLSRQLGLGAARIVIDAGHGGHDPGAKARGLDEAAIVLDVALRLEKLLLKQSGVEVVLTRRTDTYVPLEQRTEIANREGADLFLSIHANASADADARGIETYFLNFAANPEAEAVAARENAGAARNMRHLPEIVKTIALNNKIDESRDFAAAVQAALHGQLKKANREVRSLGVKQAPFMVLIGATMPSVLAEISFITNRQDANYLKTEKYRQQIAEALLTGIMKYQQSLKRQPTIASR
jgi:N-acetylmuramoyl-L-alanine amidase